jgi:hypothetical protein
MQRVASESTPTSDLYEGLRIPGGVLWEYCERLKHVKTESGKRMMNHFRSKILLPHAARYLEQLYSPKHVYPLLRGGRRDGAAGGGGNGGKVKKIVPNEAEPLMVEALEMMRRVHGAEKDHPDIAWSLSNLAGLYDSQGRYGEAEPMYVEALEM